MARRRLVVVAAAGALALAGLTGCRIEAGQAAYVGGTQYSTTEVDQVLSVARKDGFPLADKSGARQRIAADYVFTAVAQRYSAEKGYGQPTVDYASVAQRVGIPVSDPFLRLELLAGGYVDLLEQHVPALTPTDTDYREVYANLLRQGITITYPQIEPQLKQIASIPPAISLRKELTTAMKRYNVSVNPVYGPAQFTLLTVADPSGTQYTALTMALGRSDADNAVVDAS